MTTALYMGISELVQPSANEGPDKSPLSIIRDAALLVRNARIEAVGSLAEVATHPAAHEAQRRHLGGRAVLPGFVDSHTHIAFAGDRIDEMARRARGETYEQIAAAGGGIVRSAEQMERASQDDLVDAGLGRLSIMLRKGTTTCEIKSGYGLLPEQEAKQLRAIAELAARTPVQLLATVLAHSVPRAWSSRRDDYVRTYCEHIIPMAAKAGHVRFCDVFVERNVFTPDEARRIATAAKGHDLRLKLHVDQLHEGGGAALAAELGAVSADHLEETSPEGRRALADAGVIATVLPGCRLFLGKGPWPAARALRDAGCEVAVATDFNPGSCHVADLPLCAIMAVTQCGLSLEEALWGITRGGAKALGLNDRGRLIAGERADFVVLNHADWRALFYSPADPPIEEVVVGGVSCFEASPMLVD